MKELFDRFDALPDIYWIVGLLICLCVWTIWQDLK